MVMPIVIWRHSKNGGGDPEKGAFHRGEVSSSNSAARRARVVTIKREQLFDFLKSQSAPNG